MPIEKSKFRISWMQLFVGIAIAALICIASFAEGGEYRNAWVSAITTIATSFGVADAITKKSIKESCDVYTRASVVRVRHFGNEVFLDVTYSVYGQLVESSVKYFEKRLPAIGEDVGLYYCEEVPKRCMLRIYKEHRPGWSDQTVKQHRSQFIWVTGFGIFLFVIAAALLMISGAKQGEFTASAEGWVVGYEEQYNSHTAEVPGTYEYTPVVEYLVEGERFTAKTLHLSPVKAYNEGQRVTVHYKPGEMDVVLIQGDLSAEICAACLICLSSVFLFIGIREAVRRKRVCCEIEAVKDKIRFI